MHSAITYVTRYRHRILLSTNTVLATGGVRHRADSLCITHSTLQTNMYMHIELLYTFTRYMYVYTLVDADNYIRYAHLVEILIGALNTCP